jgi:hypothetical protein
LKGTLGPVGIDVVFGIYRHIFLYIRYKIEDEREKTHIMGFWADIAIAAIKSGPAISPGSGGGRGRGPPVSC